MQASKEKLFHHYISSSLGYLLIQCSEKGLRSIDFVSKKDLDHSSDICKKTAQQIFEFFENKRKHFEIPFDLLGTPFHIKVWQSLYQVKFGETISYSELARNAQSPKAVRAVGNAVGKNPIPIIVPCHRIIRNDGTIGGYSGGIEKKIWLLRFEHCKLPKGFS